MQLLCAIFYPQATNIIAPPPLSLQVLVPDCIFGARQKNGSVQLSTYSIYVEVSRNAGDLLLTLQLTSL